MDEQENQPEQASTVEGDSPNEFAEYGYKEPPELQLPPNESPEELAAQTRPAPVWREVQAADSSSSRDTAATPPPNTFISQGVRILIGAVVGAIIGAVSSWSAGGSQGVVVVWTSIGAVVGGVIVIIPWNVWVDGVEVVGKWLVESGCLFEALGDCCSTFFGLVVAIVVTIGGFLLWHSLLLAALAGGSIIVMMLAGLSMVAASYKAGSQPSSS